MLHGMAVVGRATGDDWQDGSPNAPTGDYLSTELSAWSPAIYERYGLGVTARYDEFAGSEMLSLTAGVSINFADE